MTRRGAFSFWIADFACVTAIAIVLTIASPGWVAVPVVLLFGVKTFEYRRVAREEYELLRAQLEVLESLFPRVQGDYRCTYHVPVKSFWGNPTRLRQALDYVPAGGGGGRRFPIEQGIIGVAYQRKGPRAENFQNDAEYRERMVHEYNYTVKQMGERRTDRRSYLAVPVVEGGNERVLGVFYFDSRLPGAFTLDDENPAWRTIQTGVEAIRRRLA